MHTTLRVKDGVYTNMQYYNKQRDSAGDVVTYLATYTQERLHRNALRTSAKRHCR